MVRISPVKTSVPAVNFVISFIIFRKTLLYNATTWTSFSQPIGGDQTLGREAILSGSGSRINFINVLVTKLHYFDRYVKNSNFYKFSHG
jgi:hypothetical protein